MIHNSKNVYDRLKRFGANDLEENPWEVIGRLLPRERLLSRVRGDEDRLTSPRRANLHLSRQGAHVNCTRQVVQRRLLYHDQTNIKFLKIPSILRIIAERSAESASGRNVGLTLTISFVLRSLTASIPKLMFSLTP